MSRKSDISRALVRLERALNKAKVAALDLEAHAACGIDSGTSPYWPVRSLAQAANDAVSCSQHVTIVLRGAVHDLPAQP